VIECCPANTKVLSSNPNTAKKEEEEEEEEEEGAGEE
jgi:hypothetical protein